MDRRPASFASTTVAILAFGVAFGYLEATVVVYLRAALGLAPAGLVPVHDPAAFGAFAGVEVARELATLVMIGSVGWLAGRRALERLAWTAVVFGTWDVVYYLGLRLLIGWPASPGAWDILFLVPVPWVGPVWAPIVVSAALVGFGLAAARRLRADRPIVVGPVRAFAAIGGGLLVVLSFIVDAERVLAGVSSTWSGWPLFAAGLTLAAAATLTALRQRPWPAAGRTRPEHGSGGLPPVGSPE